MQSQRQAICGKGQGDIVVFKALTRLFGNAVSSEKMIEEYLSLHLCKVQTQTLVCTTSERNVLEKVAFILLPPGRETLRIKSGGLTPTLFHIVRK